MAFAALLVGGLDAELALGQRRAGHLDAAKAGAGAQLGELEGVDVDLALEDLLHAAHVAVAAELVVVAVEVLAALGEAAARLDQLVAESAALTTLAFGHGGHDKSLRTRQGGQSRFAPKTSD